MKSPIKSGTFVAAQLSLAMMLPLMAAAAEPFNGPESQSGKVSAPTQTLAPTQTASGPYDPSSGATGIYDQEDRFKDSQGFPLPGYSRVIEPID